MLICTVVVGLHILFTVCDFMHRSASSIKKSFEISCDDIPPSPHMLRCDGLYLNLLQFKCAKHVLATAYVREFFETKTCDDVYNMSEHRQEFISRINIDDDGRMTRVLNFTSDDRDELIVAQAVVHYYDWHGSRLVAALAPVSRLGYTIVSSVERVFSFIGLGEYGGMQAALNSFRFVKLVKLTQCTPGGL
jgi:hypothetical protein